MQAISFLGLVAAIATAITAQVTALNPKLGAWVMLGGAVAASTGGALSKYLNAGPVATALGVIVAVSGVLAMATGVIPAGCAQVIAVLGTAAAAAGKSLFGWEDGGAGGGAANGFGSSSTRGLVLVPFLLLATLPMAACGKQTTLDRLGSVLTTAVTGYQLQLDQLHAQGVLDQAKYDRLTGKAKAIQKQVDALAQVISGFGSISAGDVPRLLQQFDLVAGVVESSLGDPAWTGVNANLDALRALRWVRATLSTSAVVVAGLFPPKPTPTPTTAGTVPQVRTVKAVSTGKVKIDLPPVK